MKDKRLIMLIISGFVFLFGVFYGAISNIHNLYAFSIVQFIVVVAICVIHDLKKVGISEVIAHNDKNLEEAYKERNPLKIFAYGSAIPAVMFGIIFLFMVSIFIWFMKF